MCSCYKVDGINSFGFLKQESGSYGGTPNISENISSWTSGVLSDWKGKANSEVLKKDWSHRTRILCYLRQSS